MESLDIARAARRLVWRHKTLWPFGLFAVATAGSGAAGAPGRPGPAGAPLWALALGGAALVLAALWLHVVSEGALIDGAWRARREGPVRARDELRAGRAAFGAVLRLKLLALLGGAAVAAALAAPPALARLGVVRAAPAVAIGAAVLLAAIPSLLTGYFVYVYALRFAVLDGLDARTAIRAAWAFLHGRVLESVKLLLVAFLGLVGGALAAAAAAALGIAAGATVLAATRGTVQAAIVAAAIAVPAALALAGATGAYRSAVWTLGFLEGRRAEAA